MYSTVHYVIVGAGAIGGNHFNAIHFFRKTVYAFLLMKIVDFFV